MYMINDSMISGELIPEENWRFSQLLLVNMTGSRQLDRWSPYHGQYLKSLSMRLEKLDSYHLDTSSSISAIFLTHLEDIQTKASKNHRVENNRKHNKHDFSAS